MNESKRRSALALATLLFAVALPASAQIDVLLTKLTNGQDANVPPGPVLVVGSPVTWAYVVSNSGGRDLENVAVSDDQGVVVTCPATTLGAGETMICTGSGTAQAGQYANVGTVTANAVGGGAVTASDPSHYFGQTSVAIALLKLTNNADANSPPGPVVAVGTAITWTYLVTNTSGQTLSNVVVTDDQGVTVTCPQTTLAVDEFMFCTANGTAVAGQYVNLGTVTAQLPDTTTVLATDVSHYFGQTQVLDWGDAPDPTFPTRFASKGASHLLGSDVYLGSCVDAEVDGQPDPASIGDDFFVGSTTFGTCSSPGLDEDGVTFTNTLVQGGIGNITVVANQACTLSAWLDINHDGDWNDSGETLFPGGQLLAAGPNALSFSIPFVNIHRIFTMARFRCTTDGEVAPTERADDGEVEDYAVIIEIRPATQTTLTKTAALSGDVNGDGQANPGDVLTYTVTITNGDPVDLFLPAFFDAPGANTTLVAGTVTTTQGFVFFGNQPGSTSLLVDLGNIAPGVTVTITFQVRINDPFPPNVASVENQGSFGADNVPLFLTDDPAAPGLQATITPIVPNRGVTEIPTLGGWGFLALGLLLAGVGIWRMRQAV